MFTSKKQQPLSQTIRITIVGAGPAGLTLARLLQGKGCTSVKILEKDADRHARTQGGSLDLHVGTGLTAIRDCGLVEQFDALARPEGQDAMIMDEQGRIHYQEVAPDPVASKNFIGRLFARKPRPEIDRTQLRDMLLDSVHPDTVQWGRHLVEVNDGNDGDEVITYTVKNGDGSVTRHETDLLVGADGAWSRVRPLLHDFKPIYSGVTFLDFTLRNIDSAPLPPLPPGWDPIAPNAKTLGDIIGRGTLFAPSGGVGLIGQRNSGGIARVYAIVRSDANHWDAGNAPVDLKDAAATMRYLQGLHAGWHPHVKALLDETHACDVVARRIHALDPGVKWTRAKKGEARRSMVTVMGDAAHLMSPAAGEGVNLAMADAVTLADILTDASWGGKMEAAVVEFERRMLARSGPWAKISWRNMEAFFKQGAAEDMANTFAMLTSNLFPLNMIVAKALERLSWWLDVGGTLSYVTSLFTTASHKSHIKMA